MSNNQSSVLHYTEATVSIFFPDGEIKCALCPLLETYSRDQCRRTGEYIFDRRSVGGFCPLNIKDQEESDDEPYGII